MDEANKELMERLEDYYEMDPIQDWFYTLFIYLWGGVCMIYYRLIGTCTTGPFEEWPNGKKGKGLMVVINGYRASKTNFQRNRDAFAEASSAHYDVVYSPFIVYQHRGSMKELAAPIMEEIKTWAEEQPTAPILLIGISAGGRIAMHVERALRDLRNPCHMVTIGSPLHGTSVVYISPRLCRFLCGDALEREFHPESDVHRELHEEHAIIPPHHTMHCFFSRSDWVVFPPKRCMSRHGTPQGIRRTPHNLLQSSPEVLEYMRAHEPRKARADSSLLVDFDNDY